MCIIMHHIPAGTFHQDIHYVLWMHRWGARCTDALHEPQIRHEVHCCAKRCCNALKFKMHRWTAKMHQRELACTAVPRRRAVGCGHNTNWSSMPRGFHRFTTVYRDAQMQKNAMQCRALHQATLSQRMLLHFVLHYLSSRHSPSYEQRGVTLV